MYRKITCCKCKQSKDEILFDKNKDGYLGRYSKCKQCKLAYNRSLTSNLSDVEAQMKVQNGLCGLCELPLQSKINADHCHNSGVFRSLLCTSCNVGLGQFKDDINLLQKAINYLNKHSNEGV